MNESFRGSGRTHRMVEEAKQLADQGRAVYVVTESDAAAEALRRRANDDRINFEWHVQLPNFDWESMWLRGAHPNCVVLVDHAVIEQRFPTLVGMLHRWDAPILPKRHYTDFDVAAANAAAAEWLRNAPTTLL